MAQLCGVVYNHDLITTLRCNCLRMYFCDANFTANHDVFLQLQFYGYAVCDYTLSSI